MVVPRGRGRVIWLTVLMVVPRGRGRVIWLTVLMVVPQRTPPRSYSSEMYERVGKLPLPSP